MPIPINGTVIPRNDGDFPTHDSKYGKGGLMSVATSLERDAIPVGRRSAGMLVYVIGAGYYKLNDDLSTWSLFA